MKIVVLDGYALNPGDLSWEELKKYGELTVYDRTPSEEIVRRIGDAEIVFTNKTPLTAGTFEACPSVKFVGVLATGYNVVDTASAKERGIVVTNIPTYGTTAVSQFVFALLLEIAHHVWAHSESVKAGDWAACPDFCYWNYPLFELAGRTMGIIGFGRIGQATAKIAQAFGMKVLAYDTHTDPSLECETLRYADLPELLASSDVVSLHCPLFPSTQGIINRENIAKMKDGAILINTSRGPLVVEEDLVEALESGKIAAAAVDVVSTEPIRPDNPLLHAKNMVLTPHLAWACYETRVRLIEQVYQNLKHYLEGDPIHVVRPEG